MQSMKKFIGITALGLACAGTAQADAILDTHAFTLSNNASWQESSVLLSDANGVTKLDLSELQLNLANYAYSQSNDSLPGMAGNYDSYALNIGLKQGYQITGFSLSATFNGTLNVGKFNPDDIPSNAEYSPDHAYATNSFTLGMLAGNADGNGSYVHDRSTTHANLSGNLGAMLSADHLSLTNDFVLTMYGAVNSSALADQWTRYNWWGSVYSEFMPSSANMEIDHPVLTIYSAPLAAPVPEPETYAMLLAGLAAVTVLARRRKQA